MPDMTPGTTSNHLLYSGGHYWNFSNTTRFPKPRRCEIPCLCIALGLHIAAIGYLLWNHPFTISAAHQQNTGHSRNKWSVMAVSYTPDSHTQRINTPDSEQAQLQQPVVQQNEVMSLPDRTHPADTPIKTKQVSEEKKEAISRINAGNNTGNEQNRLEPEWIEKADFSVTPRQPRYPVMARKRNQQGTVVLEIWIDQDGQQNLLQIIQSSGFRLLDNAALDAAKKWGFKPHQKNGISVPSRIRIPIAFNIK